MHILINEDFDSHRNDNKESDEQKINHEFGNRLWRAEDTISEIEKLLNRWKEYLPKDK